MREWRPFTKLAGVDVTIAKIDEHQLPLRDEELAAVESSVETRVREFTAGRSLARSAMRRFGVEPCAIPIGRDGQPVWPAGMTGSISHNADHVAVAVTKTASFRSVGIDIESAGTLDAEAMSVALTRNEMARLDAGNRGKSGLTMFSCKEAAFKAVYPLTGRRFEFRDIEVALSRAEFRITMQDDSATAALLAAGRGYVESCPQLVASIFCIA